MKIFLDLFGPKKVLFFFHHSLKIQLLLTGYFAPPNPSINMFVLSSSIIVSIQKFKAHYTIKELSPFVNKKKWGLYVYIDENIVLEN